MKKNLQDNNNLYIKDSRFIYKDIVDAKTDLINEISSCVKRKDVKEVINYNFDSVLEQNFNPSYNGLILIVSIITLSDIYFISIQHFVF